MALALVAGAATVAHAQSEIDPSFDPSVNNAVFAMAVQPDGKILPTARSWSAAPSRPSETEPRPPAAASRLRTRTKRPIASTRAPTVVVMGSRDADTSVPARARIEIVAFRQQGLTP